MMCWALSNHLSPRQQPCGSFSVNSTAFTASLWLGGHVPPALGHGTAGGAEPSTLPLRSPGGRFASGIFDSSSQWTPDIVAVPWHRNGLR
eukprot:scaffold1302_cov245-Pinguiococcus_pyrenoidosus.AAC.1